MMNKPVYTPSADWRKQFEFRAQYPTPHTGFKVDPILERYSTQQPTRYVSTP